MIVTRFDIKDKDLQSTIQTAKDGGQRILALSPSKIVKGKVTEYVLITGA